jgi:ABC-type sugar transport system ATPase subunit
MNNYPDKKAPLLEMRAINKTFPGVRALNNVSLKLEAGEVLALLGENGAGKSTLIKVLGGAYSADSGEILIDGKVTQLNSTTEAWQQGISIIYQEFNLIPELTVRENIFLGKEKTKRGFIDSENEKRRAGLLFDKIGLNLDLEMRCAELTIAQQQMVEIARALSVEAKIIVMDEPSATLTTREVNRLFSIIRDLKEQNIGIIYISHRLDEIFEVADRVMVLRDGIHIGEENPNAITRDRLIEMMVGRPLESEFPQHDSTHGHERLRVENLVLGTKVRDVSFNVLAGEILGFAGLVGAGRTETMRLIFGAEKPDSGRLFVNGIETEIRHPQDAIKNRLCLLTEDRKGQGLVLIHSCRENFGLPNLYHYSKGLFLDQQKERSAFASYVNELNIKISDFEAPVSSLSGGNQQKIVLAKWLESNADIIIFDEPTRGIDIGAKYEIYLLINKLADEGKSIIVVSSELPELLGMCDRIMVMREGKVMGEITDPSNATQEDILRMAMAIN